MGEALPWLDSQQGGGAGRAQSRGRPAREQSHPLAVALALASSVQPSCSASARVVIRERALLLCGAGAVGALLDAVDAIRHLAAHSAERRGEGALVRWEGGAGVSTPHGGGGAGGSALKRGVLDEVQHEEAEAGHNHRGNDAKDAAVFGKERRGKNNLLRVEGGKRLQRLRMRRQGSDGEGWAQREGGPRRRSPGRYPVLAQLGRARRERKRGGEDAEHVPRRFSVLGDPGKAFSGRGARSSNCSRSQARPRRVGVVASSARERASVHGSMPLQTPCARPDPISSPGSRSLPRHGPATPTLRRLDSPDSILDTLEHAKPHVPPKAIRDFRRKWSSKNGVHSDRVRKLLSLSERDERGAACILTTPGPPRTPEQDGRRQSKTERAASVLCAAARGRAVRRELALVHVTATYLQVRGRLASLRTPPTHPPIHPKPTHHPPTNPPTQHPHLSARLLALLPFNLPHRTRTCAWPGVLALAHARALTLALTWRAVARAAAPARVPAQADPQLPQARVF